MAVFGRKRAPVAGGHLLTWRLRAGQPPVSWGLKRGFGKGTCGAVICLTVSAALCGRLASARHAIILFRGPKTGGTLDHWMRNFALFDFVCRKIC